MQRSGVLKTHYRTAVHILWKQPIKCSSVRIRSNAAHEDVIRLDTAGTWRQKRRILRLCDVKKTSHWRWCGVVLRLCAPAGEPVYIRKSLQSALIMTVSHGLMSSLRAMGISCLIIISVLINCEIVCRWSRVVSVRKLLCDNPKPKLVLRLETTRNRD